MTAGDRIDSKGRNNAEETEAGMTAACLIGSVEET